MGIKALGYVVIEAENGQEALQAENGPRVFGMHGIRTGAMNEG